MRISRLKIDNYGPVRDQDWELEPEMNLFFGSNESGKTLLVESMIKLLLDGDTSDFDAIGRVTGNPAGFLLVEDGEEAVQVPDADYTDLFPEETNGDDIRNAFVIRDFDLRLPERKRDFGRSDYLRDVTDRILGSQTQKIESVQERMADLGHLANKDSSRLMNRQPEKLKQRRDEADTLAGELDEYLEQCREEGVLEKVREKREAEDELKAVERDIAELEKAEKQAKLETGQELLGELREVEADIASHEDREDEIDEYRELRRQIDAYRESLSDEEADPGTYLKAGYVAAALFALSLIAAIVSPVTGLGGIAGILLVTLLFVGYKYFEARGQLVEREQRVEEANYAGVEGDNLPTVYNAIEEAINDYVANGQRLSTKRSETIGNLKGAFDADHDSLEEWEEEIETFADEVEEVNREFDEEELGRLKEQRRSLRREIDELRGDLDEHREKLSGFDSDLQEIGPEDYLDDVEDVHIRSVEDLREAVQVLERFVAELNERRDNARAAIDIFAELEEEEEQEINQLFTEDDFIVNTFKQVTDKNYTDVWYDEEENTIRVECADGRTLTPFELSQGTYDLLYLTIRLKLATKLLGDDSGFLVFDDAFIHSDSERTVKEIEILEQLADDGWQIIYFSFRDAVRTAVEDTDNGNVIDLDPLEFTA